MTCRHVPVVGLALACLAVRALAAQSTTDLVGTWVCPGEVGTMMESVVPARETIEIDDVGVTLVRGTRPATTERYLFDGEQRPVTRVPLQARNCRAAWDTSQLVIECMRPDGGPGGRAPSITTREVRYVDREGHLVVEVTWRSGDRVATDRRVFHRDRQP